MAAMEEDATAAIDPPAEPPDVGLAWCFKSPGGFNLTGADPANRAAEEGVLLAGEQRAGRPHGDWVTR